MPVINYSGNWGGFLEYATQTVSQDIANNRSIVRVNIWVGTRAGYAIEFGNTYGNTVNVSVNGQNGSLTVGSLYTNGTKKHLGHLDFTVGHNADGTGTANFSFNSNMSNISYSHLNFGNASGSYSHGLATIPRSSSVRVGAGTIGSAVTINITRQSASFKHTVRYAWGDKSGTIATNVDTSTTWTIPLDFANDIPNTTSGTGTIFVDTYSGSTKTGTQSTTLTASVPASMKPTFTGVSLADFNTAAQNLIPGNTFIQVISNIKVTFNGGAGTYGSTITGYKAEIVGKNQTTNVNGGTLGIMNYSGNVTVRASVSDSRGRWSDTRDVTVTVLEYFAPALSFSITRTGSTSSVFTVTRNAKIAPLTVSGSQKNTMTLSFKVARLGTTSYTADTGPAAGSWSSLSNLTNSQANLSGSYAANQSWVVIGTLEDKFTRTEFAVNVATESVVFSYDRSGVGVNKIRERGALDVKGDIYANDRQIQQYQMTSNVGGGLSSPASFGKDLNNILTPGVWQIGADFANNPLGAFCILECYKLHTSNECIQRVTSTNGFMAVREYGYDNVWRPWRYVAQTSSVPLKNADHPMLQEKPLKTTTLGGPYGIKIRFERQGNLVVASVNRERGDTMTARENAPAIEKIPNGYKPTFAAQLVMMVNTNSTVRGTATFHLLSNGTINITTQTYGASVLSGTVSFYTNDPYP